MSDSDTHLAQENYEQYCYARDNGHMEYVRKHNLCRKYVFGEQWDSMVKAELQAANRPAVTINEVFAQLVAVIGEHIENRAEVGFSETASGSAETAAALNKAYIHVQQSNRMDAIETDVVLSGMMTSRGFFDVRPAFDDHLRGEARVTYKKGQNVVIDPDADSYDPAGWKEVFLTGWVSANDISLSYGPEFAKELEARSGSSFMYGYDSIDHIGNTFGGKYPVGPGFNSSSDPKLRRYIRLVERQFKQIKQTEHFVDPVTGDTRAIPENWDRARIVHVKETLGLEIFKLPKECIYWRVSADNLLLFNEASPLKHFTIVPYFPYFFEGNTSGLVEHLLDPQDMLNKTLSSELHILNSVANSGWQLEQGQLSNMDEEDLKQDGASTGLVIVRKPGSPPLEKIQPNQVPTGFDRIGYKALEYLKELSGVSDSKRGFDRADVAAKAILAKQKAGSINLTWPLFNLIQTRRLVAQRVLDIIQTYYTEERVFRITNPRDPAQAVQEITVNQFDEASGRIVNDLTIGEYSVTVIDVPSRATYQDSQFLEAVQMREMGIAIPDEVVIKHSHLQDKAEIMQSLKAPPSPEEQAISESQVALAKLEVADKEASILKTKADAALVLAKSKVEARNAAGVDNTGAADELKAAQEMAIKREASQQELALRRAEVEENLRLAREKQAAELQLKRNSEIVKNEIMKESQEAKNELVRQTAEQKAKERPAGQRGSGNNKKTSK